MGRKRKAPASRDKSSSEASSSSSSSGSSDRGGESKQSTAASTARTKRKRPELTPPDTHHVAVPDDNQDLVGGCWWEETGKRKKVMKLYMIQRIVPAQDMSEYPPPIDTTKKVPSLRGLHRALPGEGEERLVLLCGELRRDLKSNTGREAKAVWMGLKANLYQGQKAKAATAADCAAAERTLTTRPAPVSTPPLLTRAQRPPPVRPALAREGARYPLVPAPGLAWLTCSPLRAGTRGAPMEVSDDGEEADEEEEAEEEETAAARRLRERRERTAGGVTALAAAPAPAPAVTVAIPVAPAAPVPASPAAGRAVPTGVPVKTPTSKTPTEWAELGRYVRPWEQLTKPRLLLWLSITLFMGVVRMGSIAMYWALAKPGEVQLSHHHRTPIIISSWCSCRRPFAPCHCALLHCAPRMWPGPYALWGSQHTTSVPLWIWQVGRRGRHIGARYRGWGGRCMWRHGAQGGRFGCLSGPWGALGSVPVLWVGLGGPQAK